MVTMDEQIGRYQIKRLLGQGGMATVYLAHDPEFNRDVALKVLPAQMADDPQFLGRFRREAQTIAALEHPAIVPVYDFGQHGSSPYLVMRYMPGGSLEDQLSGGRSLTLAQSAALLDRLAPALDEVHRRGIVHRDLKPGNILFDHNNQAYLSDFGIVKINERVAATLTAHGGTLGTPAYMSPEQARGEPTIDSRSDIYALGVILFQVLTGELPFKADTPIGLAVAHISEPVPDIRTTRPDLPAETAVLISQALAKNPQDRPPTASVMARDLDRIAASSSVSSFNEEETVIEPLRAAIAAGSTTVNAGPPPMYPPAGPPAQPDRRRRPLTAIFGCLGFILLLAIVAGYIFTIRGSLGLPPDLFGEGSTATTVAAAAPPTTASTPTATETLPTATPLPTPVPPIGSSNTFVEYILDASGSMLEELQGKPKLLIARDVLTSRLNLLPPDINVGLRVYGHRLRWEDDEAASCRDIELVVPIGPNMGTQINGILPAIEAKGMTPMTESIRQAAADFTFTPERNNLIVLLSDGLETCDEDPAEAVMFLQELGIDFTIHVIGLNVDAAAKEQLQRLAAAGGGVYYDAHSEDELNNALQNINDDIVLTAMAQVTLTETPTAEPSATAESSATTEPPTATPLPPPTATFTPPPPTFTAVPPTATALPPTDPPPTFTAVPPTATAAPPTDPPPSPTPVPAKTTVNATFEGKAGASSTYRGFPASLAVDGDRSTSWFSGGPAVDGRVSTYQWSIAQDEFISSVTIISNANNAEPAFRTGYGFEGVTIQILDAAGSVVYENKAGLGGTPDPDVSFQPGVKGSTVLLSFSGHESQDCGGFGELVVMVER